MAEKPMESWNVELKTENLKLEGGPPYLRDVSGSAGGVGQAVVREQDDAAHAQAARRLRVLDDLIRREPVRTDAGPQGVRSRDLFRRGNLCREHAGVRRVCHRSDHIDQAGVE